MFDSFENDLNAELFNISDGINSEIVFNKLLNFIFQCYNLMMIDKVKVPNNENLIRDIILYEYLNNNEIRHSYDVIDYLFDPEVPENCGRCDIKVQTLNTFIDTKAYYLFECKRLDGDNKLNNYYVKDGIERFTTNYKSKICKDYYSSYYGLNGMIGFIVKNINIDNNMKKINSTSLTIEKDKLYTTDHKKLTIYHLMMDFSKNIS